MKKDRFLELEGIRGIAAIMVVVFHIFLIFYPKSIYANDPMAINTRPSITDALYGNPLAVFYSGLFAVSLFFVLSGFVLSIGFFSKNDENIIKKLASRRYLRLMMPALVSVLVAYILIKFNFSVYRDDAFNIIGGGSLGLQWNFEPHFFEAVKQATWSIFTTGEDSYNKVLWTMQYEFFGSMLIFLILLVFGRAKYRGIIYLVLIIVTTGTWYIGFILGMILADLYSNRNAVVSKNIPQIFGYFTFLVGLVLGGYPLRSTQDTIYQFLTLPGLTELQNITIYLSLGAILVIGSVISTQGLKNAFGTKYIANFGKYTFSLYLTHMLVLLTLTPLLFVGFSELMSYNRAVLLSVVISLPFIGITTVIFERWIDRPSVVIGSWGAKTVEHGYTENIKKIQLSQKIKELGRTLLAKN